ncbi:hypothetical protein [Pelotomaculum propionicicum]|uniref:hypothetical protein n=1 Tax=Pelotomaculum propionicicum TaxID=258475 RepID=UPI003B9E5F3C
MSAWLNLLQKEIRMTRNSALLTLAILLAGGLWLVYLSFSRSIGIIFVPAAMLLVVLLFYPAIYMLKSLAWEFKVAPHLWLHCPQPAWMLITAKLAVAMAQMLAIIIIAAGMLLLGVIINPQPEQLAGIDFSTLLLFIMEAGTYAAVFTVAASIYIGAWGALIAVAFAIAGNYLGRFRWLAGIAVFIAATAGFSRLQETWLYKQITDWGAINIGIQNLPLVSPTHINAAQIFAGDILVYSLLTVGLFALSAWLIDHKVEV